MAGCQRSGRFARPHAPADRFETVGLPVAMVRSTRQPVQMA